QVVHAVDDGDGLGPGEVLGGLFDAGVQEADFRRRLDDALPLDLQDDPQHAVGAGVVGADAQRHPIAFAVDLQLLQIKIVIAGSDDLAHVTSRLSPRPANPSCPAGAPAAWGHGNGCGPPRGPASPPAGPAAGSPCAGGAPPSRRASECGSGWDGPQTGCRTSPILPARPDRPPATGG